MTTFSALRARVRWLQEHGCDDLRDDAEVQNVVLQWQRDHSAAPHGLAITCQCSAGSGCAEPAEYEDEGVPVCGGCLDGAVWSDDGDADCACCGAGDCVEWDSSIGPHGAYVYDDAPAAPVEDPEGDWGLVDMDGATVALYATEDDAAAAATRHAILFRRTQSGGSTAYVPLSIVHFPCGVRRAGQWSTTWYSPGCVHMERCGRGMG